MLFVLTAIISFSSRPNWSLKTSYSTLIGSVLCKKPSVVVSTFREGNWDPIATTNTKIARIIFLALSKIQSEKFSNLFSVLVRQFIFIE